jgi:putative toxin-antitoxin system antitoxin component (TIGR02293 family)
MPNGRRCDMRTEQEIASVLGGQKLLGRRVRDAMDLDSLIREGLPYKAGEHVRELLDLTTHDFADILELSERTLARVRTSAQKRFNPIASDRLYRLARIFFIASKVLEDQEAARRWIHRPQVGLGGKVPVDLLHTEAGAREVEDLLWRIEYGVIS